MSDVQKVARVRVFVDGENVSPRHAEAILEISRTFGELEYARVYGAFANIPKWCAHRGYAAIDAGTGKNATDILLSIHATAIGMETAPETIVIASSDGDFKHVADFLRGKGITVIGIGERKAPEQFRKSCSQFFQVPGAAGASAPMPLTATDQTSITTLDQALLELLLPRGLTMSQCVSLLRARSDLAGVLPKNGAGSYIRDHSTVAIVTGQGSHLAIRLKP